MTMTGKEVLRATSAALNAYRHLTSYADHTLLPPSYPMILRSISDRGGAEVYGRVEEEEVKAKARQEKRTAE